MLSANSDVGSFRVDTHLRKDPFGDHYAVQHRREGSWHELVVLPCAAGNRPRQLMAQVGVFHPNLIAVLAVVDVRDSLGVVYERVEGESLEGLLGGLQPGEALDLFWDILQGVGAAHREGILHLGLGPASVIIGPTPSNPRGARVGGFRLAQVAGGEARTRSVWLSPYAAPELLDSPDSGNARTDVYALGALLYAMLTGQPPYAGSPVEVAQARKEHALVDPTERAPEVDPAVAQEVRRALSPNPEDRHPNVLALGAALFPGGFSVEDAQRSTLGDSTLAPPPPRHTEAEVGTPVPAGRQLSVLRPFALPALPAISFVVVLVAGVVSFVVTGDANRVDAAAADARTAQARVEQSLEQRDEVIEELVAAGADARSLNAASARYEAAEGEQKLVVGAEMLRRFRYELQVLTTRSDQAEVGARNRAERELAAIERAFERYRGALASWSAVSSRGRGAAVTAMGLAEPPPREIVEAVASL